MKQFCVQWRKRFNLMMGLNTMYLKRVKVSHSLIAVGVVGVRDPLYLGHS